MQELEGGGKALLLKKNAAGETIPIFFKIHWHHGHIITAIKGLWGR